MIDAHKKAFIEEATELLAELETSLLDVEKNPGDKDLIARIFRALHTIKGSSGMFGYDEITMFTHDIETVYDFIRNGTLAITKHIIDLTLEACDQISLMLKNEKLSQDEENVTKKIIASFRGIVADFNKNSNDENKNTSKSKSDISLETGIAETYLISFVPSPQIFISGTNPLMLINEMTELGEAIVLANFDSLPTIESINPEKCYVSWDVILKTNKGIDAIKDVFIFVDDDGGLKIDLLDKSGKLAKEEDFKDFESLLISVSKTKRPDIKNLFAEYQNSAKINDSSVQNLKSKKGGKEAGESTTETDSASSIRVSAEKLDELVNLVGELVTVQARLSQLATTSTDQNVAVISEEVERITWSLRDSALNIRMLPIGTTFSKFKRLVRDLSKELGKQVELSTEGAETELDKTVLEKLNDPLVHIIRNSIDHGVEKPSDREMKGKYPVGSVKLSASQSGGNVIIKISDDGAGIDKEAVKNKAINMGLINENSNLSDSDIYGLIFAAGFSTAKKVTNVSGRGVGMDVVRRAIESLRGSIEVTSKLNEGTTISLKLPLTLAIIDGLLVKIEDDNYILPLSSVEECIELTQKDIDAAHGRNLVNLRGKVVPYVNLRQKFNIKSSRPQIEQVVVSNINGMQVGFVVDVVFGQHQTVLKSLGKFYKDVEGVSGATILGDGTVALILDLQKIIEKELVDENKNY